MGASLLALAKSIYYPCYHSNRLNFLLQFRPGPHVSGYFLNLQLFLFRFAFCPLVSHEFGVRIRNFLNPHSTVKFFECAKTPKSCGRLNQDIF